jgi:hypothetical protein
MQNTEFKVGVIKPVECYKEGWELIKSDYWLLFAITLVGVLIGGATMYVLLGTMICGIFYCFLQKIDGKPVLFDDLFKSFKYFMPSLLVTALIVVPMIIVFTVMYIPFIFAMVMGPKLSESELITMLVGTLAVDAVIMLGMVCFHTLLMFAFPLIVDRNLSGWQSVKTSAKAVWANLGGVTGLIACQIGLTFVGYLALCIGVYFMIPILFAGMLVGYRKIFPNLNQQNFNTPPPPNTYNNAGNWQ